MDCIKILEKNLIGIQFFVTIFAALLLYISSDYPAVLAIFLILYFFLVFSLFQSKTPIIGLFLLSVLTLSALMIRFHYLPWGDPWFEYQMSKQIISGNSLDLVNYPAQLPVLHISVAALSFYSGLDPLIFQKLLIPLLSACGILVLYIFLEEYTNIKIALISAVFLLIGTPYIHWSSQAVRESLGMAFLILALYVSYQSMKKCRPDYFLVAFLVIPGLVLTHHLSSMIFLLVWMVISLSYILCICEQKTIKKTILFAWGIFLISLSSTVLWWYTHLFAQFKEIKTAFEIIFPNDLSIVLFITIITLIYFLPILRPDILTVSRNFLKCVFSRKKEIFIGSLILLGFFGAVIYNFVIGKSFFSTSYPGFMLTNGIIMAFLGIIGLYYCLNLEKFPLICWLGVIGIMIIFTMTKIISFLDPFRLLEYFWIPLAIVSAIGFNKLLTIIKSEHTIPFVVAGLVTISLITAFPSIVFLNTSFNQGHPLFDNRSLVISHSDSEILALSWLEMNNVSGIIQTDTYVGYAGRTIVNRNDVTWQSYFRPGDYSNKSDQYWKQYWYNLYQNSYALISSRMSAYAEFGEDWSKNKKPLSPEEIEQLNQNHDLIYDNGEIKILYNNFSGKKWV